MVARQCDPYLPRTMHTAGVKFCLMRQWSEEERGKKEKERKSVGAGEEGSKNRERQEGTNPTNAFFRVLLARVLSHASDLSTAANHCVQSAPCRV